MKAEYANVECLVCKLLLSTVVQDERRMEGQTETTTQRTRPNLTPATSTMSLLMRKMNHGSYPLLSRTVLCAQYYPLEQEPVPPANSRGKRMSLSPYKNYLISSVLPRRNEDPQDCLGIL